MYTCFVFCFFLDIKKGTTSNFSPLPLRAMSKKHFQGFLCLIFDARWRKNSRTESGRCSFNASVFCGEHGRLLIKQTFSKWCDWWGVNGDAFIAARSTKRGELARSEVEKNPDCFVISFSFFLNTPPAKWLLSPKICTRP